MGAAYSVNAAFNNGYHPPGGKLMLPTDDKSKLKVPVRLSNRLPDINTALAIHLVGGVPFACVYVKNREEQACGRFDWANNPEARSTKASITRAISSLLRAGYLEYRPPNPDLDQKHDLAWVWGYYLAEKGIPIAVNHQQDGEDLVKAAAIALSLYVEPEKALKRHSISREERTYQCIIGMSG